MSLYTEDTIVDNKTCSTAAASRSRWKTFITGVKYALSPANVWRELTTWKPMEWALLVLLVGVQAAAFMVSADYSADGWIGLATGVLTIFLGGDARCSNAGMNPSPLFHSCFITRVVV